MSSHSAILLDLLSSGYHKNKWAIEYELRKGANPNFVHPTYGASAMHLASGQGKEATQFLLLHGGDPNILSSENMTPLHVAATWGDWKTLQLLLKNAADINIQDQDGKTAYDLAVEGGNKECAQLLKYLSDRQLMNTCTSPYRHTDQKRNNILDRDNVCQNNFVVHGDNKNLVSHIDKSTSQCQVTSRMQANTVTSRIYKYLEEGKKVDFESPDTPVLGTKPAEAAYVDFTHQDHRYKTVYREAHRLQNTDTPNTSLSSETPNCSLRDTSRSGLNLMQNCSCCNDMHTVDERETAFYGIPNSHPHHKSHAEKGGNFHLFRNTQSQSHSCATSPMFHRNCKNPLNSGYCCHMHYNTRSSSSCNCSLQFATPSLNNLKSNFYRGKMLTPSSLAFDKEYKQLPTRIQSAENIYVDSPVIQAHPCSCSDLLIESPLSNYKNPHVCNITSQYRRDACISQRDSRIQEDSLYFNRLVDPHFEIRPEEHGIFYTVSPRKFECNDEKQDRGDHLQIKFSPKTVSSKHPVSPSKSDYFRTTISTVHGSSKEVLQGEIVPLSPKCKLDVIKPDHRSRNKLTDERLFQPLLSDCIDTSCKDRNKKSDCEVKDNFTFARNIENSMKKPRRRSLLKPPETAAVLPKTQMKPNERVAEFILSVQNYMFERSFEDCGLTDELSPTVTRSVKNEHFGDNQESFCHKENPAITPHSTPVKKTVVPLNTSNSSVDTFATCDEGYSDAMTNVNTLHTVDKDSWSNETMVAEEIKNKTGVSSIEKNVLEACSSKMKSSPQLLPGDDIMTSDDSYIQKTHSRVYRMKIKPKLTSPGDTAQLKEKHSAKQAKSVSNQEIVEKDNPVQIFPLIKKRLSSDSLFSTISVMEYVYRDKKSNITLIERHIPSDCGSSINRRSLESTSSRATIDSQATLIYDWHALNEVLKTENLKAQQPTLKVSENHCAKGKLTSVSRGNSSPQKQVPDLQNKNCELLSSEISNITDSGDNNNDVNTASITIPARLERMTCQEISQELLKYGEIPGPVIPATRQAYLRRLTTLESNPGLVVLSKTCPDYPYEMRQALNGQFDASGISELESKMVEVFSLSKNSVQWREGTVKSSFTYLLLDPRVTDNLPLRAKNMSDLEVLKTFICSIFYIGKGKRSRPYSHLYEAVTKLNTTNVKMSAKVKQIVDIWTAGLGVVSLHCFQSVIPVEAYTREACMIQAIGLHKLTNMKQGDVYGAPTSWTAIQRRQLGVYLLKKALQIFLAEGERQICIPDLKGGQFPK